MIPTLRRIYRIIAIHIWLAFVVTLSMPFQFLGWPGTRVVWRIVHLWNKGLARILNLRVEISGLPPNGIAGLVVSNHLGYIDVVTHCSVIPVRYTPKLDIAKWPFIGLVVALAHPVWIDRQSRLAALQIAEQFADTIKKGVNIIVYPEGTSTDGKHGILPFKSAAFEAAAACDLPVIPVVTRYREAHDRMTVCWYGDMEFLPHVWEILGFSSIEAEMKFLPTIFPQGRSRKELSTHVHEVLDAAYKS